MKQFYSFQNIWLNLSADALEWLARTTVNDRKEVIHHFTIFNDFLLNMRTDVGSDESFRRPIEICAGRVQYAETMLGKRYGFGRTRMRNIISDMEELGLIKVAKSTVGSVATVTCMSRWREDDGKTTKNQFYLPY